VAVTRSQNQSAWERPGGKRARLLTRQAQW
jgi:hypothetical protein